MTYEEYQQACSNHLSELLGITDLLDTCDPYDVFTCMKDAYDDGEDPVAFIEEVFSEDIDRQEYEIEQELEALNQRDEDDD